MKFPHLVNRGSTERDALINKAGREAETGRRLAMFDRETGLYASWYLSRRFEEEAQRSKRYSRPLSVIAIEVRSSDAYRVQDELRNCLDQGLRSTDLASHLGGGRYLALLPETVLEDTSAIAARIAERFPDDVEIGLGCFPEDGSTLEDVQRAAERRAHGNWRLAV